MPVARLGRPLLHDCRPAGRRAHAHGLRLTTPPAIAPRPQNRVRVDNTPPDPVQPIVAGGEAWRSTNDFDLRWSNPPGQHAPIVAANWEACAEGVCQGGREGGDNVRGIQNLSVRNPGDHIARVWLEDAAGNSRQASAIAAVHLRYDPVDPSLSFEPDDPADPLRIAVTASDRHSGVASGEIEMRREGTQAWHGLETRREEGSLVAYVDDERFGNGVYEFRAHATDRAGQRFVDRPAGRRRRDPPPPGSRRHAPARRSSQGQDPQARHPTGRPPADRQAQGGHAVTASDRPARQVGSPPREAAQRGRSTA